MPLGAWGDIRAVAVQQGVGRGDLPTLNTRMRRMPGMEAILINQRQPMVGFTTDARPMINKDPANQNTFPRERKGLEHEFMAMICFFPFWSGSVGRWGTVLGNAEVQLSHPMAV